MTSYTRLERSAIVIGRRLVRWGDEHFARRMAGHPDWTVLWLLAVGTAVAGVVGWLV